MANPAAGAATTWVTVVLVTSALSVETSPICRTPAPCACTPALTYFCAMITCAGDSCAWPGFHGATTIRASTASTASKATTSRFLMVLFSPSSWLARRKLRDGGFDQVQRLDGGDALMVVVVHADDVRLRGRIGVGSYPHA